MKRLSKKTILILAGNILIAVLALVQFAWSVRHLPSVDSDMINTSAWKGRDQEYRDGGVFVNRERLETGTRSDFLWGPYVPLKKGSYTAVIEYTAEEDQSCYAGDKANGGEVQLYQASTAILSKYSEKAVYQFELTGDVSEFQLVIEYSGRGEFGIRSISVVPNNNRAKRLMTETLALLLLADGLVIAAGWSVERKRAALFLLGIALLISLPMAEHGIFFGHDLDIHLLRIESAAHALRSGQFPARISAIALWGLGYPFSIYYNDLFLYLPAALRLLGFSLTAAYKVYLTAVNLLTVGLAYLSFKNIFRSRKTGLILTLLYSAAAYRMVNVYIRAAVGEYTAMAFLPLMAWAFVRIWSGAQKTRRELFENALILTLALSGILGSHILTLITAGALFILMSVVLWRQTFRKETLLTYLMTGAMTLLLNLYFILPFMDYYINVPTYIGSLVSGEAQLIQNSGVYPGQLFAFFQDVTGNLPKAVDGRIQLTPGLALMAVFLIAVYLRVTRKGDKRFRFLLTFSFLTLLFSTDVFPWNWLALHSRVWEILAQIQFPWRFLVFAVLFLTLLAGDIHEKEALPIPDHYLTGAGILMALWFLSNLFSFSGHTYFHDTLSIDPGRTGHEYLIEGTDWNEFDPLPDGSGMDAVELISRTSDRAVLYCKASGSKGEHRVTAPIFSYKGYHVTDTDGRELPIETDGQNRISFVLPDAYDGNVTVTFRDPAAWRAALGISALTAVILTVWLIRKRKELSGS